MQAASTLFLLSHHRSIPVQNNQGEPVGIQNCRANSRRANSPQANRRKKTPAFPPEDRGVKPHLFLSVQTIFTLILHDPK
ncbi:hypothetical protein GFC01_02375 [Desulfofundulus thermobenzoicus]|uniref:Uncharacterized protein n=1 Tax=Desulfofundulus thermobenzoicus TaxID=29376 RepID=A0A6N7IMC8_9FIRM|nr:hypothetical protein [Desulfofundulus thermobenzoicus]MQL51130.1 hypothetical protein [Desulfofundulus thermobenzoicus]HHW44443.1 hypothetical protein [Desulfotomaculum sp.]